MNTLHLGVHDIAYAAQFTPPPTKPGRSFSKAQTAYGTGKTTGDIAKILEARYGVMAAFWGLEKSNIIDNLETSMAKAIKNILLGQPGVIEPTAEAMEKIKANFKRSLSQRRFDGLIRGVPTMAAQRGVSHRFKKPYALRASRPSFIDTGLYQSSFTAWMD
jgi:hypothetical protein